MGIDISKLPEFDRVAETLRQMKSSSDASEGHGLMCGFICLGNRAEKLSWWEAVTDCVMMPTSLSETQHQPLLELYGYSWESVTQMDFQFQLLIPSDESDLLERAKALRGWCQGFMTGLGMAGLTHEDIDSQELRDALLHISEIARMDCEQIETSENDEQAFMEVYEYVRIAVLNLYIEFTNAQKIKSTEPRTDNEVH